MERCSVRISRSPCHSLLLPAGRSIGTLGCVARCLRLHVSRLSLPLQFRYLPSKVSLSLMSRLDFGSIALTKISNDLLMFSLRLLIELPLVMLGLLLHLLHC